MIKRSIRFASVITSLMLCWSVIQFISMRQIQLPLNTTDTFEMNVDYEKAEKTILIDELNSLAEYYGGVLLKVVPGQDDYEKNKDIVWFGSVKISGSSLNTDDKSIHWLDSELYGNMIHSDEMGTRPLYGSYAFGGSSEFKNALSSWADEKGFYLSWNKQIPMSNAILSHILFTGTGNAFVAALILLMATIAIWLVSRTRARAIRYINGFGAVQMSIEDSLSVISNIIVGAFVSFIVIVAYVSYCAGIRQIFIITVPLLLSILYLVIIIGIYAYLASLTMAFKEKNISREFYMNVNSCRIGSVFCIASVVLAMIVIPTTLTSASVAYRLSDDYALWKAMRGTVRVSLDDFNSLEKDEMINEMIRILKAEDGRSNICMSFVVDRSIYLDENELSGYDHLILADKAWLKSFDIGIEEERSGGVLNKTEFDNLSPALRDFLELQIPVWLIGEDLQKAGLSYYEYTGVSFPALPPNAGYGDSTIQAEHPLVIITDNPIDIFKAKGFLMPLLSSGNIVFLDESSLRSELAQSPLNENVASIDSVADVALDQAQKFRKEARFSFLACVLIIITVIIAGNINARLWAGMNKKRIFTLRTSGKEYVEIINAPMKKESVLAAAAISIGCILSVVLRRPSTILLLSVAIVLLSLYLFSVYVTYKAFCKKAFYALASRNS